MTRVAVIGASGFVGSACLAALQEAGLQVEVVSAPRLRTSARSVTALFREQRTREAESLRSALGEHDVVVNCAGIAAANAAASDELFGANALLPVVVAQASRDAGVRRFIQVSSAAVQGRREPLTESAETDAFSPYSASKALGEAALFSLDPPGLVIFRPTSVHGSGRPVTVSLSRLARSPLSSTAGTGTRPTPQVHIRNVAAAMAFLCAYPGPIQPIVLQPAEGMTTGTLLRILGSRPPRQIPLPLARSIVKSGYRAATALRTGSGLVRRVEMLWLGQGQQDTWLLGAGFRPRIDEELWRELSQKMSQRVV